MSPKLVAARRVEVVEILWRSLSCKSYSGFVCLASMLLQSARSRPFVLELGQFEACGNRNTRQSAAREPSKSLNLDDYSCLPVSLRMRLCRALPALREREHRNRFYRPERKFIKATVQLMGKIFFETVGAQQGRDLGCFHVFLITGSC